MHTRSVVLRCLTKPATCLALNCTAQPALPSTHLSFATLFLGHTFERSYYLHLPTRHRLVVISQTYQIHFYLLLYYRPPIDTSSTNFMCTASAFTVLHLPTYLRKLGNVTSDTPVGPTTSKPAEPVYLESLIFYILSSSTFLGGDIMPHIVAPLAMPSQRNDIRIITSKDLNSLNANLTGKKDRPATPVHRIREHDYTVPAPPPPSPVSFRSDPFGLPVRR